MLFAPACTHEKHVRFSQDKLLSFRDGFRDVVRRVFRGMVENGRLFGEGAPIWGL